jgi:hypothetical protein
MLQSLARSGAFWTATDAAGTSSTIGAMRRLRGCKAGLPDILIVYRAAGSALGERRDGCARLK